MEKENYNVVQEAVATSCINRYGNVDFHTNFKFYFLKNDEDEIISHQYYCIEDLGLDHFAVATLMAEADYIDYDYYNLAKEQDKKVDAKIKWAIMRVNRNQDGKIIPGAETLVTPYIYDRISSNNLATATVYCEGKLTYVDIDVNSQNYGKQLVPCILNHTVPFDTEYSNLAECSIEDTVGYLPRTTIPKEEITKWDLLTVNQAKKVCNLIEKGLSADMDEETAMKYKSLTGVDLGKTNGRVLRKARIEI